MLHIDEKYLDVLNEIEEDEADVLEEAYKVQPNSRLACAIEVCVGVHRPPSAIMFHFANQLLPSLQGLL